VSDSTPRARIDAERRRRGDAAFVADCVRLLRCADVDDELVRVLGGPAAAAFIGSGPREDDYWLRVWAARGLLWGADGSAQDAVSEALHDEHWRVREMALKVIARHHWGDLLEPAAALGDDPVPRVRAASARTVRVLTSARD
jgi:hypothetical protein